MTHLRLASAKDAAPDPRWLQSVDEFAADLKARSDGFVGCSFDLDGNLAFMAAGNIAPDSAAGFLARCLASMANQAGDE
jgi:hypothetical protein